MRIEINNYKNVRNLDVKIQEDKINYLFGISGSGKTSIVEAIIRKDLEENCTIGIDPIESNSNINGTNYDFNNIRIYNMETVSSLLIDEDFSKEVYTIIFDDKKELDKATDRLIEEIQKIEEYRDKLLKFVDLNASVTRSITGKITKNLEFPRSSKILKLHSDVSLLLKNESHIKIIKKMSSNEVEWKIKGKTINNNFNNKICPFCEHQLQDEMLSIINSIAEITPKNLSLIKESNIDFNSLGIKVPEDQFNIEQLTKFKDDLMASYIISQEIQVILNFLSDIRTGDLEKINFEGLENIGEVYKKFPELEVIISNILKNNIVIKELKVEVVKTFNILISNNLKRVNSYIKKLGIPYKFALDHTSSNIEDTSFKLYHKDDDRRKHRVHGLSFGEKNMIALILFMLVPTGKILLIDDPASSYDDFRRKTILDLIYNFANNRTCIILSHDHVFLKYALLHKERAEFKKNNKKQLSKIEQTYLDNTGLLYFMENYSGSASFSSVLLNDFNTIQNHIKNHLEDIRDNSSSYRKAINLRLLYEFKKLEGIPINEKIYGYLSAILHKTSREEVMVFLSNNDVSEEQLLNEIKDKDNVILDKISIDYYEDIDTNALTPFEKAIYIRENTHKVNLRDELNNIVHFNDTLAIGLNPYKFNTFSKYVYSLLNN